MLIFLIIFTFVSCKTVRTEKNESFRDLSNEADLSSDSSIVRCIKHYNSGLRYRRQGNLYKSAQSFAKAYILLGDDAPHNAKAKVGCEYGYSLFKLNEKKKSLRILNEALSSSTKLSNGDMSGIILLYIGDVHFELDEYPKAIKSWDQGASVARYTRNRQLKLAYRERAKKAVELKKIQKDSSQK